MSRQATEKYLKKYAEPVARVAREVSSGHFSDAIVIPAFDEETDFAERLAATKFDTDRLLIVVVVNARDDASSLALLKNRRLLRWFASQGQIRELSSGVQWIVSDDDSRGWLAVDATSEARRLAPKEGVGRARKMGLDLALALRERGVLKARWVGSSDADSVLRVDYFRVLRSTSGEFSAVLFPYEHLLPEDRELASAMISVELTFRYYVLGLAHAGSPYAYHSLGSALAVNLEHYAQVRGVPNRQAGEDFYLLSKLSKLAPVRRLKESTIGIEARLSDRVPFGTGPSLRRTLLAGEELKSYHPLAFEHLREFLTGLVEAARSETDEPLLSPQAPEWVRAEARRVLREARPHLAACPSLRHRIHRIHERFDALATLQFIHRAHREGLQMMPITHALKRAEFIEVGVNATETLAELVRQELALTEVVGLKPA